MMNKILRAALPVIAAAAIMIIGFALPERLLNARFAKYFGRAVSYPIDEIHPYGEDYDRLKSSLLPSLELFGKAGATEALYAMNAVPADELPDSGKYIRNLLSFLCRMSGLQDMTEQDLRSSGSFFFFIPEGGGSPMIGVYEMHYAAGEMNMTCFDPESGIPLYAELSISLPYGAQMGERAADKIWEELTDAYSYKTGVRFSTEHYVSDESLPENASIDNIKPYSRDYYAMSGDNAFRLSCSVISDGQFFFIRLSLQSI